MRPLFEYEKKYNLCGKIGELIVDSLRKIVEPLPQIPSLDTWTYELQKESDFTLFHFEVLMRPKFQATKPMLLPWKTYERDMKPYEQTIKCRTVKQHRKQAMKSKKQMASVLNRRKK